MPEVRWIDDACARRPDHVAIQTPTGSATYAELAVAARDAAAGVSQVGRVRRLIIERPGGLDFAVALHGAWAAGAAVVPIDPRLGPQERATLMRSADAALEDCAAAPALVVHTSGSTAAPKPVILTRANLHWSALGSAVALGLHPDERWLCALPVSHLGGMSILARSAISATTAVVLPSFDAGAVLEELMRPDGATLVSLVPTTLIRLLDAGLERPPRLRCALLGGAPVAPALMRRARCAGVPVRQTYGLTEACSQVTTQPAADVDPAAADAGPPLFCTRVKIAGDGEILVRGPTVAPTARAQDGWLHTGDLGALDEQGRLTVTGRKADTIVTGGENVAPTEVEAALLAHPAVADAAVHAHADERWGESVVATVVLREDATAGEAQLREHCRSLLAGYKVPKRIRFVGELPRTASGKLRRSELAP